MPAGSALAVDREVFSQYITDKIKSHPLIDVVEEEVTALPKEGICICATGPLTDGKLADEIATLFGGEGLHFYDAVAPIVSSDSIDMEIAYFASR